MTAPRRPRTPPGRQVRRRRVPSHVFWVRRAVVLGVVAGLVWAVVGLAGLLDLSMHNNDPARATTTGAESDQTDDAGDLDEAEERRQTRKERRAARIARAAADAADPDKEPGKPMPDGPCADSDVVVTPSVPDGHAANPVEIVLELTTRKAEACTWQVDPESVFVTITEGTTTLWSSQHCPRAIPEAAVVPRRDHPDRVRFDWSGKESQPGCSVATDWVWPGTYTINAVARGSVAAVDASFALGAPEAVAAPAQEESESDSAEGRRAERRDQRRAAREEERAEQEAEQQAEREQARRDALEQAREAKREERRQERAERRAERRDRRADRDGSGSGRG